MVRDGGMGRRRAGSDRRDGGMGRGGNGWGGMVRDGRYTT